MADEIRKIERVQTGVRLEKRVLKVLKAVASKHDMSMGELLEGILLHNFEGKLPFSEETLTFIEAMRMAHGLDLTAKDSHIMKED
ncbi:hypothetical protein [uncultured Ruegeria sp.]|uniref:hypothetical protein n=1 Tax=uncultured Ruegeria sp. TaxID=259304 RepID=UPI0026339159|nr:hypothetical protein [uncultured Ruegeria sp.]